jgi:hypothetical protein
MPLFFTLTIAVAAILLGATAADGRWWRGTVAFDAASYRTVAECLRLAYQAGAPSSTCPSNR